MKSRRRVEEVGILWYGRSGARGRSPWSPRGKCVGGTVTSQGTLHSGATMSPHRDAGGGRLLSTSQSLGSYRPMQGQDAAKGGTQGDASTHRKSWCQESGGAELSPALGPWGGDCTWGFCCHHPPPPPSLSLWVALCWTKHSYTVVLPLTSFFKDVFPSWSVVDVLFLYFKYVSPSQASCLASTTTFSSI